MVDGPLYSRFIILCLDKDGESKSFFFIFLDGRASLQILSLLREGRRSEVTKVEENGLKDFFFFSIVIESLRWSENESRNNLLRFPARTRPPGSFCYLRRRRRRFCSCPRHRWQWFELWKIYVRMRYATTKMILALYVYVNYYRDFKVILSDHCVNAYMRGWCLSNSQRWRERCRSAEADWADVDTEGLVVAADVVGGDVDDR